MRKTELDECKGNPKIFLEKLRAWGVLEEQQPEPKAEKL